MSLSTLQTITAGWAAACFPPEVIADMRERALRVGEESIELMQAERIPEEAAHRLVRYVYSRPVGEANQELGGVLITSLVYAEAKRLSAEEELTRELVRIIGKIERIRQKQATKGGHGVTADTLDGLMIKDEPAP